MLPLARLALPALCLFSASCADSSGAASSNLPPDPTGLPTAIPDGTLLQLEEAVRPVQAGEILRFDLVAALTFDGESPLLATSSNIPVIWLPESGGDAVLFSQAEVPEAKTLLSLVPDLSPGTYSAIFDLGLIKARVMVEVQEDPAFPDPQAEIALVTGALEQRLSDLNQSIASLADAGLAAAMAVLHANVDLDLQNFKATLASASTEDARAVAKWLHANRKMIEGFETGDAAGAGQSASQTSPQEAQGYHDWELNLDLAQELSRTGLARVDSGLLSLWSADESSVQLLAPSLDLLEVPALMRALGRLEIGEGTALVGSSMEIPVFPKSLELKLAEVSAFHLGSLPEGDALAFGTGAITPVTLEGISGTISSASRGMRHPRVRLLVEDIDDAIECLRGDGLLFDSGGALDADILDLSDQLQADFGNENQVSVLHNLNSAGIEMTWSNQEIAFFPLVGLDGVNSILALLLTGDSQADTLELSLNANRPELEAQLKTTVQVSVVVN
ncbi:MAG: hypothetical protein ACYTG5_20130, partial [Planctomycetota bacterium]